MLIPLIKLQNRFGVKPSGVLHIGSNIGEEAIQYEKAGIKNVVWFEADPQTFEKLQETLKNYPTHRAFNNCIGDEDGKEMPFHRANNKGQSSSLLQLGTHKRQHPKVSFIEDIQVVTRRLDALDVDFTGIDYLSADVQCSEMKVLKGMGELLRQFKWLYIEVNRGPVYIDCPHVNDLDLFLNGFGFKRVFTADWIGDWTDALYIKR